MSTVRKEFRYGVNFQADTKGLKVAQQELQKIANMNLAELKVINSKATEEELSKIKSSANSLHQLLKSNFNEKLGDYNLSGLKKSLEALKNPTDASVKSLKQLYEEVSGAGAAGSNAFRSMTAEILTTNGNVKETSKLMDSLAKTLSNNINWKIASTAINLFTNTISNAWSYTKRLDSSLNDIRIVTEKSNEEMEKFAKTANKAAKSLGASTTSYTNAALIYYQQGLGEKDVQARTKVTLKAANVTGQSAAEVSEQLTAVWNGYKVVAQEAELYVDKLAAVAASTAADLEELSTGMSKVASAANAMGVDVDQLSAQLSTIVSVTRQDASVVGTALKTIFSRMGDLKVDGVDEFGVSLGDVSGQLKQMGIEVLDQEGNLRDMGTVIEEVAEKWGTWTDAQQQAAAVAIAGKRQYNNLIALFENWDMYESAKLTSQTSAGTLQKQQEIYLDSLEAKLNRVKVAGEKVFDNLIDTESTKVLIDFLGALVEGLAELVDGFGGLAGILTTVGPLLMQLFNAQITHGMQNLKKNAGMLFGEVLGINKKRAQNVAEEFGLKVKDDAAVKDMVKLREEELKNSRYLTAEEQKRFDLLIKQRAELANRKAELEEEKKALKDMAKEKVGVDVDDGNFQETFNKKKSDINSLIYKTSNPSARNDFDQLHNELFVPAEAKKTFGDKKADELFSMTSAKLEEKYYTRAGNRRANLTKKSDEFVHSIEGLITVKKKEEQVFGAVDKVLDKSDETYINLKNAQEGFYNGTIEGKQYLHAMKEALRAAGIELDKLGINLDQNTEDLKENAEAHKRHGKEVDENSEKLKKAKIGNTITDISSAAIALVGVGTTVSHLTKEISEGTVGWGDALSSTLGMITSMIPVIISLTSVMGPWGILVGVIVAAVAALIGVLVALPKAETELEKANKALEAAKEKASEAREEYGRLNSELEELKNTISNINTKELELDSLIPGTVAYQTAIADLNQQILELVETYPQLAEFLDFENGRFTLQKGALENLQEQTEKNLFRSSLNILATQEDIFQNQNEVLQKEKTDSSWWRSQGFDKNSAYTDPDGKTRVDIDSEGYSAFVRASSSSEEIKKYFYQNGLSLKGLKGALNIEELANASQEELKTILDELSEGPLKEAIKEMRNNNQEIEQNNVRIAELNDSYKEMMASSKGIDTKTGQAIYKTLTGEKNAIVSTDQQDEYLKRHGLYFLTSSSSANSGGWNNGHYVDYKDSNGETKSNRIGGKLNENEMNIVNQQLKALAEEAGLKYENGLSLSQDFGGKKVTEDEMREKEDTLTIDGQKMSVNSFIDLATQTIYDNKNQDYLDSQVENAAEKIAGAENSQYGALGFYLANKDAIGTLSEDAWSGITLSQARAASEGGSYTWTDENGQTQTETFSADEGVYNQYVEKIKSAVGKNFNGEFEESWLQAKAVQGFSIDQWELFGKALSINQNYTLANLNGSPQELLNIISLITDDETTRTKYTNALGMSAEFGQHQDDEGNWINKKGYSGVEIREMAIENRKLELDYTKQIADEMERAFGTNRLKLLKEMTAQQEETARLATKNYLDLVGGATAVDRSKFIDEDGNFDYTKALDYQAQLEADNLEETDAYAELTKIINAYEKMNEFAWAVTDAKIAEWKYSFEIVEQFKGILDSFRQFQNETKNWSKGISAYRQESVVNTYDYLTQQWESQYAFTQGSSLKRLDELKGFQESYELYKKAQNKFKEYQEFLKVRDNDLKYDGVFEKYLKINKDMSFADFVSTNNLFENYNMTDSSFSHYDEETGEFYFDEASYSEEYQSALDSALNSLEGLKSIVDNLFTAWENGLKELQDLYDNVIKQNQDITKLLQNQINLNKLLNNNSFSISERYKEMIAYGEENFELANAKAQQMLTQYQEALKTGNKAMIESARSSLVAAASEVSEWANSQMDLIENRFKDLVNKALEDMMGESLDVLSLDWSLELKEDERYLDEVNEAYALDMMSRRFQAAIDETDSIEAQNKLMEKRAEIEAELAEIKARQGKLSQYDLDRAEALYDVTLKQIALEEAQNTANTMKLTRDAFGNYTYQYVADEDAVAQAYEEVATAQNNLYNLQKEHQKELVNDWSALWTQYTEDMAAAQKTGNDILIAEVYDRYFGENGFLREVKDSLETIVALGSDLPFNESLSVQSIINMNFDEKTLKEINESTTEEVEGVNNKLETANDLLGNILNELQNNKYFGATDTNGDGTISSEEYNTYIASQKDNINEALRGIEADMGTYMEEIAKLEQTVGSSMTDYLLSTLDREATKANTAALEDLTNVMYDVIDAFEDDGEEGQITFNDKVVYVRDNDGDWAIKANDTNS